MKKILTTAALIGLSATCAHAEEAKSSYSITLDFPYVTNYTFRGVEYAKDSIQPSVELAYGDFYAGVWTNQPITNNADNEFDFYAGYKVSLNDFWYVDAGVTAYYYPEADTSTFEESTYEGFLGLNGNVMGFKPGLYVYHDFTLDNTTVQGQVGYTMPLGNQSPFSLDFSLAGGRVYADAGDDYNYGSFGLNIPCQLSERATVYVGATYTVNDLDNIDNEILSGTAGISLSF